MASVSGRFVTSSLLKVARISIHLINFVAVYYLHYPSNKLIFMRSYRFLCLIVSSIVFFALPTAAQNTVQFKKETIDSVLETFDHSTRLPGYSLAIVHKGEVIYTANRGKASID